MNNDIIKHSNPTVRYGSVRFRSAPVPSGSGSVRFRFIPVPVPFFLIEKIDFGVFFYFL